MADSLLGRFGGTAAPVVSFDTTQVYGEDDLLVYDTDSLVDIEEKISRCKEIVESGGSLAVALGTLQRSGNAPDYAKAAIEEMTPNEGLQYKAFLEGSALPALNVERDRENPKGGPSARTRDERRLAWLRRAYKNDNLSEHNLQYFHSHYSQLIPFLCAGAKVIGMERAATNNSARDARYLAEQVAASKLAAAASARQNQIQAEIAKINRSIAAGIQTLQARKEVMKPHDAPGKKKKVPLNETRSAVGLPPIGDVSRWRQAATQGRGDRYLGSATAGPSTGVTRTADDAGIGGDGGRGAPRGRGASSRGAGSSRGGTRTRGSGSGKQPTRRSERLRSESPRYTPEEHAPVEPAPAEERGQSPLSAMED